MAYIALDSGVGSEEREFGEEAVDRCAATDSFDAGNKRAGGLDRYRQRRDLL
jgi:hypothetical protein